MSAIPARGPSYGPSITELPNALNGWDDFSRANCVSIGYAARSSTAQKKRQEFEQLDQAWPWSGLARFGPTTPKRATTSLAASVDPTEAGKYPTTT
jgi:hypothetical protein